MTNIAISMPSARRIIPLFYYFGSFDDLFLYTYHDRLYNPIMSEVFTHISDI